MTWHDDDDDDTRVLKAAGALLSWKVDGKGAVLLKPVAFGGFDVNSGKKRTSTAAVFDGDDNGSTDITALRRVPRVRIDAPAMVYRSLLDCTCRCHRAADQSNKGAGTLVLHVYLSHDL